MNGRNLFPAFLDLRGRKCVVVGGGDIALQKIGSLLVSGAVVHVVAPEADLEVQRLAQEAALHWSQRRFEVSDLDDVFLAVAATGDREINAFVFREADARRVLCNSTDDPEHCHFQYPAVIRRGRLQIAISTAGSSPALAQRLRRELETQFGTEYEPWLEWLGSVRAMFFRRGVNPNLRKPALHRIARREVYERFIAARRSKRGGRGE